MRMSPPISDSSMSSFGLIPYTEQDIYTVTEFSRVTQYSEVGEQRLVWVFSTLEAQSRLQPGASPSDRVKNSDRADDSPNPTVTTLGQVPGSGVSSAKLETHIGQMNHSPHLREGLPGILRRLSRLPK